MAKHELLRSFFGDDASKKVWYFGRYAIKPTRNHASTPFDTFYRFQVQTAWSITGPEVAGEWASVRAFAFE
jgi:hypothetical protein